MCVNVTQYYYHRTDRFYFEGISLIYALSELSELLAHKL